MDTNTILILVGIAAYFFLPKLGSLGTLLNGILKPQLPANPNLVEQIVAAIAKMLADRFLPQVQAQLDAQTREVAALVAQLPAAQAGKVQLEVPKGSNVNVESTGLSIKTT